jgi:hypothetical protein
MFHTYPENQKNSDLEPVNGMGGYPKAFKGLCGRQPSGLRNFGLGFLMIARTSAAWGVAAGRS